MKKIVVKIGSSSIVDEDRQLLHEERMSSIAQDIRWLQETLNKEVILMSSGALAWGRVCMKRVGHDDLLLQHQQIAGACGQIGIAAAWASAFCSQSLALGQLLLIPGDAASSTVSDTVCRMLSEKIIPYINENIPTLDQYDNDGLAADVAHYCECDTLILLSDVDGVYSANPKTDDDAYLIREIDNIDEAIQRFGGGTSTTMGTGGMVTKLRAAKRMSEVGVETIIASGEQLHPLKALVEGKAGTVVKAGR